MSSSAVLAGTALLALVLGLGLWCQARVEREYALGGLLSLGTVWLVWILYSLQVVLVAVPAARAWGPLPGPTQAWRTVGSLLVGSGAAFALWGAACFRSLRRMNGRDTSALVTTGAYRYSRNPQNLGIGVAEVGAALLGPSSIALAMAALFWVMFGVCVLECHF